MRNKEAEKLFKLAYTDAMTGVYNRNAYEEKLEKLNEQIAKRNDRNRKIWRAVFIAVVIFAVISLGTDIAVLLNNKFPAGITSGSIGIIGGADGPTNIYVSDISFRFSSIILAVIAFAVSVAGFVKTRKK